jgi:hypothetical protein
MKTAITIIMVFGVIITLVVYGTREALKDQQPKFASRISRNAPAPKAAERVKIIEMIKVVEVPVTTIHVKETVERVVYVPEKTIVIEINLEPAPPPTPQPVTCPAPQPAITPAPQTIIISALQPPPRPAYTIRSPRRPFHPQIASRGFTSENNRAYHYYRAARPNFRRY